MTVGELLQKLSNIETIENQIKDCSVGLVKIPGGDAPSEPDLIGSGTLVKIEGKHGILTAQHVIPHLMENSDEFGLSILPYEHRCTISKRDVHVVELPKTTEHPDRPDVAFILMTGSKVETIQAIKSFWNISYWRDKVLSNSWDKQNCLWVLSGCPGESSRTQGPTGQFETVKSFENLLGSSGIEREYTDQEFDYLDVSVLYQEGIRLPKTFGGVSGGGLWQIPVCESEKGVVRGNDPILSGLAFLETKIEDNKRWLVCHGPRTIYCKLYGIVLHDYSA